MRPHALLAGTALLLVTATVPANAFHNQLSFDWVQTVLPPICARDAGSPVIVIQPWILQPVNDCEFQIVCESDGPGDGAQPRPVPGAGLRGLCWMDYDSNCDFQPDVQPAHGGCGFLAPCPFPQNLLAPICGGIGVPAPPNPPTFSQYRMCDLTGTIQGGPVPSLGNTLNQQFNSGLFNSNYPCHHFRYGVGDYGGQTNQDGVCIKDDYLWRLGLTFQESGSLGSHVFGWLPHMVLDTHSTADHATIDDVNLPTAYGSYRTDDCTNNFGPGKTFDMDGSKGAGVVWVSSDVKDDIFMEITGEIVTDKLLP
jgi:hypothetical protein